MSGKVTLHECQTIYTIDDLLKYEAMLDVESSINGVINEED